MAEVVLRARFDDAGLADHVTVESAGTGAWHVGKDADPRSRATLQEAGYEFGHSARQFDVEWFDTCDLILAMDQENLSNLRNLAETYERESAATLLLRQFDPSAPAGAEVPDPYYGGDSGFREVLAMVERAADGVVAHVRSQLASSVDELETPQDSLPRTE
jgi:protein-tyrosine phosphatase